MQRQRARIPWHLLRWLVYMIAIVVILFLRGGSDLESIRRRLESPTPATQQLRCAGADLAPVLIEAILDKYQRDYPGLDIRRGGGGSAQALEDLVNDRVDIAFLIRPPSEEEHTLFRAAEIDSIVVHPIALSAVQILRGAGTGGSAISTAELRDFLDHGASASFERIYAPDPNSGLWSAFLAGLQLARAGNRYGVVFLADESTVVASTRRDSTAIGLVSGFTHPSHDPPPGLRVLPVAFDGPPIAPEPEQIAADRYPLYHYLYAASRRNGSMDGAMFITHLISGRGQRQIEGLGFLPAQRVLREIHLTTHPVGKHD